MNVLAPVEASPAPPPVFAKHGATLADVEAAPPGLTAQLIGDGLSLHPRPAMKHSLIISSLSADIVDPFGRGRRGPGGWWILIEPEIRLSGAILVPDLAGWRRERMPELPDAAAATLAPDWACEVLSPGTRRFDLGPKRDAYAAHGVRWLWIIDPDARILEGFELIDGRWTLLAVFVDKGEVALAPFAAAPFTLEGLFP